MFTVFIRCTAGDIVSMQRGTGLPFAAGSSSLVRGRLQTKYLCPYQQPIVLFFLGQRNSSVPLHNAPRNSNLPVHITLFRTAHDEIEIHGDSFPHVAVSTVAHLCANKEQRFNKVNQEEYQHPQTVIAMPQTNKRATHTNHTTEHTNTPQTSTLRTSRIVSRNNCRK